MNRVLWKSKRNRRRFFTRLSGMLFFVFLLLAATLPAWGQKLSYPPARYDSSVIDNYHGTKVADPYRWLEDPDSPETQSWVEAENKLTRGYLDAIPAREKIESRLTKIWNYPKFTLPVKEGSRYFFSKNEGLQNQYVLYWQENLNDEPKVLIDPNKLSEDGTVALTTQVIRRDGKLLAYGLSKSGSDQQEIKIRNIDTGLDFDETLKWCKFAGIAWAPDGKGFYYNRYPEAGTVAKEDENNFNRVYWHAIGAPQARDVLIYERPDRKEFGFSPIITEDGKYLILYVWHGTDPKNRIYYRELASKGELVKLLDDADALYSPIDNDGPIIYFHTDLNAPRGRIIAIDTRHPGRENWKEVLPQEEDVISSVSMINNQFVAVYKHDAHNKLKIYNTDGTFVKEIELPTIGSVAGISGKRNDKEMFYSFTSFLYPTIQPAASVMISKPANPPSSANRISISIRPAMKPNKSSTTLQTAPAFRCSLPIKKG